MEWWTKFYEWLGSDQSANLAQWAGGLGTVVAILFGLREFKRDRVRSESEQARLVTSWLENNYEEGRQTIVLRNMSNLPIYNVEAWARPHLRGRWNFRSAPQHPDERRYDTGMPIRSTVIRIYYFSSRHGESHIGPIESGKEVKFNVPIWRSQYKSYHTVAFTDSGSRRWHRFGKKGVLLPVSARKGDREFKQSRVREYYFFPWLGKRFEGSYEDAQDLVRKDPHNAGDQDGGTEATS